MPDLTMTVTQATIPASAGACTAITWETGVTGGGFFNYMPNDGKTALIVWKDDAGTVSISIASAADPYGRTADVALATVATVTYAILGPFPPGLWNQTGVHAGQVKFTLDAATKLRAIRL